MVVHPFNEGTQLATIFTLLADGKWHCGKHELPGTQPAKPIQIIRQHGFEIENDNRYCNTCHAKTVHRRLTSTEPQKVSFVRKQIPTEIRRHVLQLYKNTEAISLREMVPNLLEVDHRFPQVRWADDEVYSQNITNEWLYQKFQLLTREHNLWKSRYCERCFKTGERGTFIGIDFFYTGGKNWDASINPHDERGCQGCFWYDPEKWRKALNLVIKSK